MKLVLVRHGETEWNKLGKFQGHQDIALNTRGISQARETAQEVVKWQHSAVFASPLQRTTQVAQEISALGGKPIEPVPGLMELSLGELEGVTGEEMRAGWPEVFEAWRMNPASVSMPQGESLLQLQNRAYKSLEDLESANSDDEALILVSHNFAIRTVIGKILGMPLSNFHCMSLNLSSISVIDSDQRGRRLVTYNSTCHLSPENR